MAHPFKDRAMTGQELANARYTFQPNNSQAAESAVQKAAVVDDRSERSEDNFTGAPARQVSETGKVRK